jgi:predicted DsbA family dithiol-disulfide isomerase
MGISSVPTFVFNRRSALNGAQPKEVFEQVLSELSGDQA